MLMSIRGGGHQDRVTSATRHLRFPRSGLDKIRAQRIYKIKSIAPFQNTYYTKPPDSTSQPSVEFPWYVGFFT